MERLILEKKFWIVPLLVWTAVTAISYFWNRSEAERHVQDLALSQGRLVFKIVESMRLWNARHGGLYAPVTLETPPNPYLEGVPERDIATPAGRPLTLVNPAYMTRQLADALLEHYDIRLHLTSLKPLNPGNEADAWEKVSLQSFETGETERLEFTPSNGSDLVRYIAPLRTRSECLKCHKKQGYKVGDVRGGLSVSFSAASLAATVKTQHRQLLLIHGVVWLVLVALSSFALLRFRDQMLSLGHAKEHQDALVAQRTAELRQEVSERAQAEARLRLLINSSGDGIYGVDADGRCTFSNPTALRLFGFRNSADVLGRTMHEFVHGCQPDSPCRHDLPCKLKSFMDGLPVHEEDVFCRVDGSTFPVEYRCRPIFLDGEVVGAVVSFADITERKRSQELIWRQANYDQLTNVPNRNLFFDRLDQAIAQAGRSGTVVGLLFLDLDGFKAVNDRLGHEAGDVLLREAARRLVGCVRESDTVARLGGDEFTVILPQLGAEEDVEGVAAGILECFTRPFLVADEKLAVTASIGIAVFPRDGEDSTTLVKHADEAMYWAKEAGHNSYRRYVRRAGD